MKFDFPWVIRGKSELSADYTAERYDFPGYNSREVKLSADYTRERHAFPRYNPRKGMLSQIIQLKGRLAHDKIHGKFLLFAHYPAERHAFRRIIRGKSKFPAYHTTEKHAFPQNNPQKVKTFRELSCGKFQYTRESQNLTF